LQLSRVIVNLPLLTTQCEVAVNIREIAIAGEL